METNGTERGKTLTMAPIGRFGRILWIHVQILQQNCLWKCWFVVNARASVSMSACTDFEVERTVHSEIESQAKIDRIFSLASFVSEKLSPDNEGLTCLFRYRKSRLNTQPFSNFNRPLQCNCEKQKLITGKNRSETYLSLSNRDNVSFLFAINTMSIR